MQIYWPYIQGMLTNLGPLPAERIQMMLSMFVVAPNKYDSRQEDLNTFLADQVRADLLERVAGGSFALKS